MQTYMHTYICRCHFLGVLMVMVATGTWCLYIVDVLLKALIIHIYRCHFLGSLMVMSAICLQFQWIPLFFFFLFLYIGVTFWGL